MVDSKQVRAYVGKSKYINIGEKSRSSCLEEATIRTIMMGECSLELNIGEIFRNIC